MGSARLGSTRIVRPSDFGTRGPSVLILDIVFCPCLLSWIVLGSFCLSRLSVWRRSEANAPLKILPSFLLFLNCALRGAHYLDPLARAADGPRDPSKPLSKKIRFQTIPKRLHVTTMKPWSSRAP